MFTLGKIYFLGFFIFFSIVLFLNAIAPTTTIPSVVIGIFLGSLISSCLMISKKSWGWLLLSLVLFFGIGFCMFYLMRDESADGNAYHFQVLVDLFSGKNLSFGESTSKRLNYYPKTIEILFSGFGAFFSNYDMGRIFKIVIIFFSFFNIIYFLITLKKKFHWSYILISLIFVLNPVVIYQMFTFYIDDVLYLFLLNFMLYFLLGEIKIAGLVFALMISAKLSYLGFGGLALLGCIGIKALYEKKNYFEIIKQSYLSISHKKYIRIFFCTIIFLIGVHQYLINSYRFHNPLYGFIGEGKVDIFTKFQPPRIRDANKLKKFLLTFFSYSKNYCTNEECLENFSLSKDGIKKMFSTYNTMIIWDPNIGGFGNFFSILLIISCCCFVGIVFTKKERPWGILIIIGGYLLISIFILPFPWARYFPLFYYFPLILGIFASDKKKITIRIILGIYLLNTILICIPNITHQYLRAKLKIYEINTIKQIDPIDTVFYVKDTSNSFLSNKFLSFYTKQFKDAKIQEISEKEIMEYCGISEIAIEQFTKCPNEGIILVADFWNIFVDYFYLK